MTSLIRISRLFESGRPDGDPVAFGPNGSRSWSAFRRDVAALTARLRARGGRNWLLLCDDAYGFAVALMAALHAGGRAVLPSNHQVGHVAELAAAADGILVHELSAPAGFAALPVLGGEPADIDLDAPRIDPDTAEIVLHTSGSTGAPVPVRKPLRCFEAEIATLAPVFSLSAATSILATVPAHHIYGLLFRVLWPLAAGRAFARGIIRYPEELMAAVEAVAAPALISSPAFLKRAIPLLDLPRLRTRLHGVFSSGGPLPPDIASAYNAVLDPPISEIYGSTETGGIGHRVTTDAAAAAPWTPLPDVTLRTEPDSGRLSVQSDHMPDEQWFCMGDRVEILSDGRFLLLGRVDRVVKVEEQRLSLVDIEQRLSDCPEVAEARVLPLPESGRATLGAVVVPTQAGWDRLAADGKPVLTTALRAALRPHIDAVGLPRKWRFVRRMPESSHGKTTAAALTALFQPDPDDVIEPEVLRREASDAGLCLQLRVPADLLYFNGHFDVAPILAGVAQVDWAIRLGKQQFGIDAPIKRMEAVKFFAVLEPGDQVMLHLGYDPEKRRLQFRYAGCERDHSTGRVIFQAAS